MDYKDVTNFQIEKFITPLSSGAMACVDFSFRFSLSMNFKIHFVFAVDVT